MTLKREITICNGVMNTIASALGYLRSKRPHCSYSSTRHALTDCTGLTGRGEFNVPFGNQKRPAICDRETLLADSELLQRVEILSGDYTGTFQNYGPNTLYYFDPPYRPLNATSSFNDYSKEPFNDGEQVRLKEFCDRINQECQHFMVSNSDCMQTGDPFFDNLYSSYQIERVSASRAINSKGTGRGKISELLIHN